MRFQRLLASVLALMLFAPIALVDAQTGARDELWGTCREGGLARHEIQFIGTAGEPITYHFSGEAWVEEARQQFLRAEAALNALQSPSEPELMSATVAMVRADQEFRMRRAATLPPFDLTLTPVVVEERLSGDPDAVSMVLLRNPAVTMQPGARYVISGTRSSSFLPPAPMRMDNGNNITEYVEAFRADSPDAVARDLEWLASLDPKAAIVTGNLMMENIGGPKQDEDQFRGTRVIVSSAARDFETAIAENGRFELRGLPPGRLLIRAVLPKDLTLTLASKTTIEVLPGSCTEVRLKANINGRVRGRIRTNANPGEPVRVRLLERNPDALRTLRPGETLTVSHALELETSLKPDGTFEFYGVRPGWYVLLASVGLPAQKPERHLSAYYPGTSEMGYATPIEVGRATVHEGFDFPLTVE